VKKREREGEKAKQTEQRELDGKTAEKEKRKTEETKLKRASTSEAGIFTRDARIKYQQGNITANKNGETKRASRARVAGINGNNIFTAKRLSRDERSAVIFKRFRCSARGTVETNRIESGQADTFSAVTELIVCGFNPADPVTII